MEDETPQQYFDVYLAMLTDSAYPSAIFSLDDYGRDKTHAELLWEASIAEDQGLTPIYAMWSREANYFISFSPTTGLTGYFSNFLLAH